MIILLDSSVIIDALRAHRGRRELLEVRQQAGDTLACSVISVAEIYAGMKSNEARDTDEFFRGLECIEVTHEIARHAGQLKYEWGTHGKTITIPDAIIAATTLKFNLFLATDNRRDFPMPDLKHFDLPTT